MRHVTVISLICISLIAGGCAKNGGITLNPNQIDWAQTSKYYHDYIVGFAVPVGSTVAAIAVPEATPLIALASNEAKKLDDLIAAKASDATIADQANKVQEIIQGINHIVGEARGGK